MHCPSPAFACLRCAAGSTAVALLLAHACTASWALSPTYPEASISAMQQIGALGGGSVSIMGEFEGGTKLSPCSGTMLTPSVMLTASHCFGGAMAQTVVGSTRIEFPIDDTGRYSVAQGPTSLFKVIQSPPSGVPAVSQGPGATGFGKVEAVIRLDTRYFPDLALALVRPLDSWSLVPNMGVTRARLGAVGDVLQTYNFNPQTPLGPKILGYVVGHSYGSAVGDRTRLGSMAMINTQVAFLTPELGSVKVEAPSWYYTQSMADVHLAATTPLVPADPERGAEAVYETLLHQQHAQPIRGDSGGGLFALDPLGRPVLIGVTAFLSEAPETGDLTHHFTAIDRSRTFIDNALSTLQGMSTVRQGKGAANPFFFGSSSDNASTRISVFDLPVYDSSVTWLAVQGAQGPQIIGVDERHAIFGLDFGGALSGGLTIEFFNDALGTYEPLVFAPLYDGVVWFDGPVRKIRVSGTDLTSGPLDTLGLGFFFVKDERAAPAVSQRTMAMALPDAGPLAQQGLRVIWESPSPVPEPQALAMLAAGVVSVLGWRRRAQTR